MQPSAVPAGRDHPERVDAARFERTNPPPPRAQRGYVQWTTWSFDEALTQIGGSLSGFCAPDCGSRCVAYLAPHVRCSLCNVAHGSRNFAQETDWHQRRNDDARMRDEKGRSTGSGQATTCPRSHDSSPPRSWRSSRTTTTDTSWWMAGSFE